MDTVTDEPMYARPLHNLAKTATFSNFGLHSKREEGNPRDHF